MAVFAISQATMLMALGQPSLRQMVARVDSGVKTVPDLKGKKLVAKRKALAELELVSDAMLKVYGMSSKDVKYIATARTDATRNSPTAQMKMGRRP